jgi:outer membrane protein, multidrug efflux system
VESSATRQRVSPNSPSYLPGHDPTLNNFDLEADLSYEIDLWGRVRNTVNAAKAIEARRLKVRRIQIATQAFIRMPTKSFVPGKRHLRI